MYSTYIDLGQASSYGVQWELFRVQMYKMTIDVFELSWTEYGRYFEVGLDNLYFQDIIDGKEIHLPVYDFKTHSRVVGRFTVSQSANQSS